MGTRCGLIFVSVNIFEEFSKYHLTISLTYIIIIMSDRYSGRRHGQKGIKMYNKYMDAKEINVKVGDRVNVQGNTGTVTEVLHSINKEWDGTKLVDVEGTESTTVRVHFDEDTWIAKEGYGQYQDGHFGGYIVIE